MSKIYFLFLPIIVWRLYGSTGLAETPASALEGETIKLSSIFETWNALEVKKLDASTDDWYFEDRKLYHNFMDIHGDTMMVASLGKKKSYRTLEEDSLMLSVFDVSKQEKVAQAILRNSKGFLLIDIKYHQGFIYVVYDRLIDETSSDLFISKFDLAATHLWETELGNRKWTFNGNMIQADHNGRVFVLTNVLSETRIDIIDEEGEIIGGKILDIEGRITPKSFILNDQGNFVVIGNKAITLETYMTSKIIIFELDTSLNLIREQEYESISTNLLADGSTERMNNSGIDIVQAKDGKYYFFGSAYSATFVDRMYAFKIVGKIDEQFQLLDYINIDNRGSVYRNSLIINNKDEILFYQGAFSSRHFLHKVSANLDQFDTYSLKGMPNTVTVSTDDSDKLTIGGGISSCWIATIDGNNFK